MRISGTVPQLSSYNIPFHSVVEVKQWGRTGLKSLNYAFNGNFFLKSVASDKIGSFEDVISCSNMFSQCINLIALPDGLLDYCTKVTTFASFCSNAKSLQYVPQGLFDNCLMSTTFASAFNACESLVTLPEGLFAGLEKVNDFSRVFGYCSSLQNIPGDLFLGCISVSSFADAFE